MAKAKKQEEKGEQKPWDEIAIGDQVKHAQWGVGTVLFRSGSGDDAKAVVVFPEEGQKKVMLKFAKLVKVGSAPKSEVAAKIKAANQLAARMEPAEPEEAEAPEIDGDDEEVPLPDDEEADIFEDDEEEKFSSRGESGNE